MRRVLLKLLLLTVWVTLANRNTVFAQTVNTWNGRSGNVTLQAGDAPNSVLQYSGSTADAQITACLAANTICDARAYGATAKPLASTVVVPINKTLIADPATLYQPLSAGMTLFQLEPAAVIDGVTLDCSTSPNFSGAFIATDSAATYDGQYGRSMSFRNVASAPSCLADTQGALVELITDGKALFAINGEHVYANGLGYGLLFVSKANSGGGGFINGAFITDFRGQANITCVLMQSQGGQIWSNWIMGNCEGNTPSGVTVGTEGVRMEATTSLESAQVWGNHIFLNVFDYPVPWHQASSSTRGNEFHGEFDGTPIDVTGGLYSISDAIYYNYKTPTLSTTQGSTAGTTCTIGGYFTLSVENTTRKVAYCN